jgi:protein involved in polysaccharide export with SLBB domain
MQNNLIQKQGMALVAIALCLSIQTVPAKADAPLSGHVAYAVTRTYRMGSGDTLNISVYPQIEYSAEAVLVRSDGNATFPIIGQVSVSGKTIAEVQQEIEAQLNQTIRNYKVSITVANTRPAVFYLSGAVNKLGPLEIVTDSHDLNRSSQAESARRTEQNLMNILTNAGGVKLNADLSQVQVKNSETGATENYNLWKVLKEADASQNPWLNPGDSVFVPQLPQGQLMPDEEFKIIANSVIGPKNFPVRVIGQVSNPNLIHLEGETPLLSTAIAMAGGYTPQGMQNAVAVRRFTDDSHFTTLFIDARKNDLTLRPNDIVYVGEAKVYKAGRYMEQVAHILSPFQEAAMIGGYSAQTYGFGGWNRNLNNTSSKSSK